MRAGRDKVLKLLLGQLGLLALDAVGLVLYYFQGLKCSQLDWTLAREVALPTGLHLYAYLVLVLPKRFQLQLLKPPWLQAVLLVAKGKAWACFVSCAGLASFRSWTLDRSKRCVAGIHYCLLLNLDALERHS